MNAKEQAVSKAESPLYAALDLGTNNCRLLIARANQSAKNPRRTLKVLDSYSRIVRLGQGVSETGLLADEAMDRTLKALTTCKYKLQKNKVDHARLVATEACRRASNAPDFLRRVKQELGLSIEIISNEEEARLAFLGCSSLLEKQTQHAMAFDIGGGSTEFMWVRIDHEALAAAPERHQFLDWLSLPYGVMNLSEKFGGAAYTELYFDEIVERLMKALRPMEQKNHIARTIDEGHTQMLSTSGTVTTLAAIHLNLTRYDRSKVDGLRLSIEDIRHASRKLMAMSAAERAAHPCIGSERTDFILSGCAMFEAITTLWPVKHITIADRGVREGIIVAMMRGKRNAKD